MERRGEISSDLLFYGWYFVQSDQFEDEPDFDAFLDEDDGLEYKDDNKEKQQENDPLKSKLFESMMKTYTEILRDTTDKEGWKWLKKHFISSLIWFLPHPHRSVAQNHSDSDLNGLLFCELLHRVEMQSKKQSDLLLKDKINQIKSTQQEKWNALIEYNVIVDNSDRNARQDICGCLMPKYTKSDLNKYGSSTHFSPTKHYDKNIYLNELLFNANIIDNLFQKDVKMLINDIHSENQHINVTYRAGPLKTLSRSQTKIENDYIHARFP
eukprot:952922_1